MDSRRSLTKNNKIFSINSAWTVSINVIAKKNPTVDYSKKDLHMYPALSFCFVLFAGWDSFPYQCGFSREWRFPLEACQKVCRPLPGEFERVALPKASLFCINEKLFTKSHVHFRPRQKLNLRNLSIVYVCTAVLNNKFISFSH